MLYSGAEVLGIKLVLLQSAAFPTSDLALNRASRGRPL